MAKKKKEKKENTEKALARAPTSIRLLHRSRRDFGPIGTAPIRSDPIILEPIADSKRRPRRRFRCRTSPQSSLLLRVLLRPFDASSSADFSPKSWLGDGRRRLCPRNPEPSRSRRRVSLLQQLRFRSMSERRVWPEKPTRARDESCICAT